MPLFILLLLFISPSLLSASSRGDHQQLALLINQQRMIHQQSPLKMIDRPSQISANLYLDELVVKGRLSHTDDRGEDSLARYRRQGGTALIVGEILANGPTLESIMTAWLKSPRHYEAIIAPQWSSMAIALDRHEGRYSACVIFTNTLFNTIRYTSLDDYYQIKAYPYVKLDNIALFLNQHSLPYTKKKNYFIIVTTASQGDYITLKNEKEQGDTVMIKGRG